MEETNLVFTDNQRKNFFGSFGRSDVVLRMSDVVGFSLMR